MKRSLLLLLSLAVMLPWASAASAQSLPAANAAGIMHGSKGLTLYTYDADTTPGTSRCSGPCAALWPPYIASADAAAAAGFSVITRADGRRQWAFHGKPLYRYAADQATGDVHGDGLNGSWHIARQSH